jgi:hypothetical protein
MLPTVTSPRMTRIVALIVTMVLVAAACSEGLSRQAAGDVGEDAPSGVGAAAGTADGVPGDGVSAAPAKLYDPASMASFSGELTGSEVALSLDSTTTGVIGGIRAGECPGDAANPYDRLVPGSGELYVDEEYIERSLGGQRIIQNFDVLGSIIIVADNVILRCGRVRGDQPYSIVVESDGVRMEWIEASQDNFGKTILGGGYEAYRCDISGGEDGLHINRGGVTVTECYIHDQNFIGEAHPDAIQASSEGVVEYVDVVRSKLISFYKAPNAALQINVANRFSITDSYLWGGVYSILGDPGNPGVVTDNLFGWDSSQFGFLGGVDSERSGNVWWEWSSPKCSGDYSADVCETPADHPGNGTPVE